VAICPETTRFVPLGMKKAQEIHEGLRAFIYFQF
jgi:hypothetical protein